MSNQPSSFGNASAENSANTSESQPFQSKMPQKKTPMKLVVGVIVLALTLLGGTASYLLTQTSQDVRQQASADLYAIGACCINNQTIPGMTPGECTAASGSIGICSDGNSCTREADCPSPTSFCNLTSRQCESLSTAVGNACNPNDVLSTGNPGQACCVGGATECKSGSCSGNGEGTIGTCLGGVGGGPGTGDSPTEDSCKADGYDFRCGGCNGFCGNYEDGSCNEQAVKLCNEVVQFGSCAITVPGGPDTYDENQNMCTHYCTNILDREGTDCSASAGRPPGTCTYVSPRNPLYKQMCPDGNGYTSFGWTGSCFEDVDTTIYNVNSYYCPCPNGDCTDMSFGQGCQDGLIAGEACFQGGTCGVLQVDVDLKPDINEFGLLQHASQNLLITSGCAVQPSTPPTTPPTAPPTNPPANYFCNSTCTTDAQCQTADSNFTCNAAEGNRCRLNSNPTSANCQPAVGPMCLSLSLTNISNPTAGATEDPQLGDAISFTCGLVNGADHYEFRVIEPGRDFVFLNATGATSEQYTITRSGPHVAQCRICTGADQNTCQPYPDPFFEPLVTP